jgi:hypothetical protein
MKNNSEYTIFYTNDGTPPPYLYEINVVLKFENSGIQVFFAKNYLQREEVSLEELEEEGFSDNDDIELQSRLTGNWVNVLQDIVDASKGAKTLPESANISEYLQIKQGEDIYYKKELDIEYLFEELLQGIVENEKFELPLSIDFSIPTTPEPFTFKLTWNFSTLSITSNVNGLTIPDWSKSKQLLNSLFSSDFSEFKSAKKCSKKEVSVHVGDGFWYEIPAHYPMATKITSMKK